MPLEAKFYLPKSCSYSSNVKLKSKRVKEYLFLTSTSQKGATVAFKCQ